jgi:hypothetical protein
MDIPKGQISWLVGRMHVSTSDNAVRADIRKRCTAPMWTEEKIVEAELYALSVFHEDQDLYRDVVNGNIGRER